MTKRFTPKASTYTEQLASVQSRQGKLRRQLAAIDAEETALKAFLMPYYNEGKTEVATLGRDLVVTFSATDRQYLNQEKAKAIILAAGKKVPYFHTDVVSFKVRITKKG